MSWSWWPFGRRSGKSEQSKSPGKQGGDKRLSETRRIVRHLKKEALRVEPEPEEETPPPPDPSFTITNYGDVVHVNFHRKFTRPEDTIEVTDPVTKKTRRVARRFNRSDVFYTKDGRLIDDADQWVG